MGVIGKRTKFKGDGKLWRTVQEREVGMTYRFSDFPFFSDKTLHLIGEKMLNEEIGHVIINSACRNHGTGKKISEKHCQHRCPFLLLQ